MLPFKIIKHQNSKGRILGYRGTYVDGRGLTHSSVRYSEKKRAQDWLYAQIHMWCDNIVTEKEL